MATARIHHGRSPSLHLQKYYQAHKNQLGREAGLEQSLARMSNGFKDSTEEHFRLYAPVALEMLAAEAADPSAVITPVERAALNKLKYKLVCPAT